MKPLGPVLVDKLVKSHNIILLSVYICIYIVIYVVIIKFVIS